MYNHYFLYMFVASIDIMHHSIYLYMYIQDTFDMYIYILTIYKLGSDLPCFVAGPECKKLLADRFFRSSTDRELKRLVNNLIDQSIDALSSRLYDNYQVL